MKKGVLLASGKLLAQVQKTGNAIERARGLLGRPPPPAGCALLIEPCAAIHTWAMAYAIDAVFLDARGCVVRVADNLLPWCFARCSAASAVLEFAAGEAARLGLRVGIEVEWKEDEPEK